MENSKTSVAYLSLFWPHMMSWSQVGAWLGGRARKKTAVMTKARSSTPRVQASYFTALCATPSCSEIIEDLSLIQRTCRTWERLSHPSVWSNQSSIWNVSPIWKVSVVWKAIKVKVPRLKSPHLWCVAAQRSSPMFHHPPVYKNTRSSIKLQKKSFCSTICLRHHPLRVTRVNIRRTARHRFR